MVDRQKTVNNSRGGDIILETSFEWSSIGVTLCLIFINDLDDDLSSKVFKFADNTKVFRTVNTDADKETV